MKLTPKHERLIGELERRGLLAERDRQIRAAAYEEGYEDALHDTRIDTLARGCAPGASEALRAVVDEVAKGPLRQTEAVKLAAAHGIPDFTIRRLAKAYGVKFEQRPGEWWWHLLPDDEELQWVLADAA